jgi:hypothetical protein
MDYLRLDLHAPEVEVGQRSPTLGNRDQYIYFALKYIYFSTRR